MQLSKTYNPPHGFRLEAFSGRTNTTLLEEIAALRVKVWRSSGLPLGPEFPKDRLLETLDGSSFHYALLDREDRLVAATRLTFCMNAADLPYQDFFSGLTEQPPFPVGYIARLVVDPSQQKSGLGYFLDTVCIETTKHLGGAGVLCDIPDYRLAGMQRRGFRIVLPPTRGVVFPTLRFIGILLDI